MEVAKNNIDSGGDRLPGEHSFCTTGQELATLSKTTYRVRMKLGHELVKFSEAA